MNTCIFSPSFNRTTGGIPNTAYYMAVDLSKAYKVYLFANEVENEEIPDTNRYIFQGNKLIRFLTELRKYLEITRKGKYIAVCMNWRYALVPFISYILNGGPYIVLCHGNEVLPYPSRNISVRFESCLRKMILSKSKVICANSNYTASLVKNLYRESNVRIIHPCSGEDVLAINESKSKKKKYILSVGRLEERKGFQYVVIALKNLKQSGFTINYYIAGSGPYENELINIINANDMQDSCHILGRVSEEEKKKLLDCCELLVMPSFYNQKDMSVEGFGIVYIEANAYGKPVIGTDSGGIPDAIKDRETGLIVPEKDVAKLSEAIKMIINQEIVIDPLKCKEWARVHQHESIMEQYIQLINELK